MQNTTMEGADGGLRDPHPAGKPTIYGLQALRFIAAAMVVTTHALNREAALYNPHPLPIQAWLEAGVDIFFVISGFIMVYILKPDSRPGAFWLQRFTRIAPLYWTATLIAFIGGLLAPDWFFGRADWPFALQSALFMPLGSAEWPHPLISPGWTLIYEFAFYTLLALCLTMARPAFASVTVLIVAIVAMGQLLKGAVPWLGFYSDDALMLEFLFGMGAAVLVRQQAFRPWQGLAIAGMGFVLISNLFTSDLPWPRGIRVGLPAFLVVFGFLVSEPLWQRYNPLRQFARLGDASYSIYLVHFFFVTAIATAFQNSGALQGLGPYVFVGLMIVLGIGAGTLAHIFIEKPLLRTVRALLPGRGTASASLATAPVEKKSEARTAMPSLPLDLQGGS